jgi:hypothetical protein
MIIGIFIIVGLFFLSVFLIGYLLSGPVYTGNRSDHFNGEKFINPGNVEAKGLKDVIKWALNRQPGTWEKIETTSPVPFDKNNPDSVTRVTFINHSTLLIQVGSYNILTDPVWSDRASPFQWIGPKRMRPPGIDFDQS